MASLGKGASRWRYVQKNESPSRGDGDAACRFGANARHGHWAVTEGNAELVWKDVGSESVDL